MAPLSFTTCTGRTEVGRERWAWARFQSAPVTSPGLTCACPSRSRPPTRPSFQGRAPGTVVYAFPVDPLTENGLDTETIVALWECALGSSWTATTVATRGGLPRTLTGFVENRGRPLGRRR